MSTLFWLLAPRNSLGPALALVLIGFAVWVLHGRRRRQVWPALLLAGLGLGAAAWRLSVVWIPRSLDVTFADRILLWSPHYGARTPRPIRIQGDEIRSAFSEVRVKPGMTELRGFWWIRFEGQGRTVTYRVSSTGEIAEDLPDARFQDHYVSSVPDLPKILRMELHYMYDR